MCVRIEKFKFKVQVAIAKSLLVIQSTIDAIKNKFSLLKISSRLCVYLSTFNKVFSSFLKF